MRTCGNGTMLRYDPGMEPNRFDDVETRIVEEPASRAAAAPAAAGGPAALAVTAALALTGHSRPALRR